jgi:sugar/nucleoside kinase (ribokinase family)
MIALSDVLLGSGAEEFSQVTGTENIHEAAALLLGQGAGTIIARDGGSPILILGPKTDEYIPVRPVTPVSTLGAGDSFDAMFLCRIAAGDDIGQAVRKAADYAGAYISAGEAAFGGCGS